MLILPHEHRAPFVAPGRRNRKVHWNRQRSRAIASLGKFEREDWRRALWLPESLRQFEPKFNNQFSPGGGSGCGCCGTLQCPACLAGHPDSFEVVISGFANNGFCASCTSLDGTFICDSFVQDVGECSWTFAGVGSICGATNNVRVQVRALSNAILEVYRGYSGGFGVATWWENYGVYADGARVDCDGLVSENVTLVGNSCGGSPTCEVTSL